MQGNRRAVVFVLLLCAALWLPGSAQAQTEAAVEALQYRLVFTKGVSLVFMPTEDMPAFVLTIRTFGKDGSEEPQQIMMLEDLKKNVSHTFTLSATGAHYWFQFQPAPATWAILGDCIREGVQRLACPARKTFIPIVRTP